MSAENLETAQADYQAGRVAFERGEYRKSVQYLEAANAQVSATSRFGGEVKIWLVTAYEAAGQHSDAIDLCRVVSRHPDYLTRKEGKRLLYILEAPQLKTKPEWLTQIPDLTQLSTSEAGDRKGSSYQPSASTKREAESGFNPIVDLPDPTQVNTKDNQFVWVALLVIGLLLGSLVWFS